MFLLYVDESGNPKNPNDEYFVLGAVAVYETKAYFLSEDIDKVQAKWFPKATSPIEFHAAQIYNRNCEPWHSTGKKECTNILFDLCDSISGITPKGLYLFGTAVHRKSFPRDDCVEKAFYELCGHFDEFIEQSNLERPKNERNKGLIIFDSSKYKGHLDLLLKNYSKWGGTKFGKVKNFADAPVFADSTTTRLLQVADLVAYSIFRRYESGDTRFLDRIISRFQQSNGRIHGLMHLVAKWQECTCPACMSRFLSQS